MFAPIITQYQFYTCMPETLFKISFPVAVGLLELLIALKDVQTGISMPSSPSLTLIRSPESRSPGDKDVAELKVSECKA
jgi:hypothetical protein